MLEAGGDPDLALEALGVEVRGETRREHLHDDAPRRARSPWRRRTRLMPPALSSRSMTKQPSACENAGEFRRM